MLRRRLIFFLLGLFVFLLSAPAAGSSFLGERDLDMEDRVALRSNARREAGAGDLHGRSWVSLVGYYKSFVNGREDFAAMVVLGIALDRIAAGPMHNTRDPPAFSEPPAPEGVPRTSPPRVLLSPALARATVAAAWRTAGLGVDDTRIDAMVSRARLSAVLPEARFRVMRLVDDRGQTESQTTTTPDGRTIDYSGVNLWLEARLTWRLDRLLYADDEPTLERVRIERNDARGRIAARILEALFQWQRAMVDVRAAAASSREEQEAALRVSEGEATLDVLTGGWFSTWRAAQALVLR
jgi:hypothetical protein